MQKHAGTILILFKEKCRSAERGYAKKAAFVSFAIQTFCIRRLKPLADDSIKTAQMFLKQGHFECGLQFLAILKGVQLFFDTIDNTLHHAMAA